MIDFKNQVALITGASGSIGSACSKMFHKLGAHVIIHGTNEKKLQDLGNILKNNYTIKICDLNNLSDCSKLIDDLEQLDILVCNAGITLDNLALRMSDESFYKVINVNLNANFCLNRQAIKKMLKNRFGRIINISSVVGINGNPGQSNYCASKAGLIGMTKALAREVAPRNITINSIAPGFIKSNMTLKLTEEQCNQIFNNIPMKRLGTPEDVAKSIVFLASDLASYITGHTLNINGGMLMI